MQTLQVPSQRDLHRLLADTVFAAVAQTLQESQPGHCLRISTLPVAVMRDLCKRFNRDGQQADVVMVAGPNQRAEAAWHVTATRLIELRNTGARPLLAFVPSGLRAAAEDSFDISTFVEIDLGHMQRRMRTQLRATLPELLQQLTDRVIDYLETTERLIADTQIVRYYLTLQQNGFTEEAAGGALFQLKLVPDFALLAQRNQIEARLARNIAALRTLTTNKQPLLGRIHELRLQPNTLQADLYAFLRAQPHRWGEGIAATAAYRPLAFDCWQFEGEEVDRERLLLYVEDPDLPSRNTDRPTGADNPRYLDVQRATTVKIKWETNPKPAAVADLKTFRIELVSTEGAVVWESKNIPVGASTRPQRSKTLKVAEFRDRVEDGLYFFRMRAYAETGEIINEEDADTDPKILRDPRNPEGKRINESDDIWFWVEENEEGSEPPPVEPQRNLTVSSFWQARLPVQFAALERGEDPFSTALVPQQAKTGWATTTEKRAEATYHIIFDAQTRFTLPVSSLLRRIEAETLAQPDVLGRWRLCFNEQQRTFDTVQPVPRQFRQPAHIPAGFLDARRALFEALQQGKRQEITATVDLLAYEELIVAYADAYQEWLDQVQADFETLAIREEEGRRRTDPLFLDLDIVEVIMPASDGPHAKVYLLAPTHPLRLLWHLQQARLARTWLTAAVESGHPQQLLTRSVRAYLQHPHPPANLPPFIRAAHEHYPHAPTHFYVEQGALTPFWSLYMREDVRDRRVLRAQVQQLLGLGRRSAAVERVQGIGASELTAQLMRYLLQHPYVQTLKLNVFNPGDAGLVVDAILELEQRLSQQAVADGRGSSLRYELRLFARTEQDVVGSAVDELRNPERQVSPEADAFTIPSHNHLFPKLRFSRNRPDDFLRAPDHYEAHISILHDLFPVEVALEPAREGRSSFVFGLIQEQVTRFAGDATHAAWQRQLLPAPCQELPDDPLTVSARIATLLNQTARLHASVHAGRQVLEALPTLQIHLGEKGLLFQIHEVSDWVFLIDRHLGLDYFDSDAGDDRPVYLLDFTPAFGSPDTDRLLLTTRAIDEVTRLIQPHLAQYDLLLGDGVDRYMLHLLRSLSGRLALKLLAAPNSVSEVLGLAAARLFLEQYGLLTDRIVIPLDAHSHLFSGTDQPLEEAVALPRGDLLLVACDPETRTLHLHIIEVKWRTDLGDLHAVVRLQKQIECQLTQSETTLRGHFDPHLATPDRIDRQIKTRELITLLTFYLERSRRYGLVHEQAIPALRHFIEHLDAGYQLTCACAGLIFDFGATGLTPQEEHAGLVFHQVGQDYLRMLLRNGLARRAKLQEHLATRPVTIEEAEVQAAQREQIVRDTSMSGDASYQRVRTHFELPGQTSHGEHQEPPERSDVPPAEDMHEDAHEELQDHMGREVPDTFAPDEQHQPATPAPGNSEALADVSGEAEPSALASETAPTGDTAGLSDQAPAYAVLLGESSATHQYGILGQTAGKRVALDLNGTNTISLFGVQGGGKSYTVGSIVEMATHAFPGINVLPSPLASVIFHYHESQDYAPEFVSMNQPNDTAAEVRLLAEEYGAQPTRLEDVLILTSADKRAARQAEFPSVQVEPIAFASSELTVKDWRFLMGVFGDQLYMKQINLLMRELREQLTLEALSARVRASDLSESQKRIVQNRLTLAAQFIDDQRRLASVLRPGRLIIVDLRDEFIEKDEALGLFVVMLNIFANAGRAEGFNKLIVFDEAHKYMDNPGLTRHIVDVIRQMRHQGVSILIASQDPPSLPNEIIELSSLVILHRFNSPQWVKHVQRSVTALADLTPAQMAVLRPGEGYVWANKTTEPIFTQKAQKVRLRPRVTRHGGGTKTAVQQQEDQAERDRSDG